MEAGSINAEAASTIMVLAAFCIQIKMFGPRPRNFTVRGFAEAGSTNAEAASTKVLVDYGGRKSWKNAGAGSTKKTCLGC